MAQNNNSHFNFSTEQLSNAVRITVIVAVGMLTLFLLVQTVSAVRSYPLIGEEDVPGVAQNTISVTGQADMDVHPDVTTFSFSTDADGKTVEEAQSKAATLNNKAIAFLKSSGVAESDIKTTSFNTETKYSNSYRPCVGVPVPMPMTTPEGVSVSNSKVSASSAGYAAPSYIMPPCGTDQVPTGFTTYQSVEVKVRNIDKDPSKTGKLIAGLGAIGVKASSPMNTIDNPDTYRNAVRELAIAKARAQAETLARDLGVKLVRVVSFNENNGGYYPGVYAMGAMAKSADSAPVVPEISAGTNKISSEVSITYQIR